MVAATTVNTVKSWTDEARVVDEPEPDVGGADMAAAVCVGGEMMVVFHDVIMSSVTRVFLE